jgi:hypothetical protein
MERYNLKKLNDIEGKEQFRVEVPNRFAALEDLDTEVESNSAKETIRENIKISAKKSIGYFEFKKHKPWFYKGCSKLLNGDNLNKVRREASRHFRNKKEGISERQN